MADSSKSKLTMEEVIKKMNQISPSLEKYGMNFIILGGSIVQDRYAWWSDIDIFVSIPKYKEIPSEGKIQIFKNLNYEIYKLTGIENIEISFIENLPIDVKFDILQSGVLIHEYKIGSFSEFKYMVMNEYYDYKIWIDQFYKYAGNEI